MKNLVYKEMKISIQILFLILPILLSLLFFIPRWIFILVYMYFFWITAPQIYSNYIAQQDQSFSMMLPISKKEYVKSKIYALFIVEGLHFVFGLIFALIHNLIYGNFNFFFDINIAFFGVILVLFTLFNVIFLPQYFKTGYFYGKPIIIAIAATMVYTFIFEFSAFKYQWFRDVFEGPVLTQSIILLISIIITIFSNLLTLKKSVRNYESSL